MPIPSEIFLFGFLIIVAMMVAVQTNLFAAAMLTGVFSLLSACLFTLMDAVDVAFTEAAVGAGISTVLVLGTLALTDRGGTSTETQTIPFVVVILTGIVLMIGTLDMEPYGSPKAPIHTHVAAKIVKVEYEQLVRNTSKTPVDHNEEHPKAVGLPNIVTSILGSYRGYDTLGETGVIFTAGVGVMLLLMGRRKREDDGPTVSEQDPSETDASDSETEGTPLGDASTLDMVGPPVTMMSDTPEMAVTDADGGDERSAETQEGEPS